MPDNYTVQFNIYLWLTHFDRYQSRSLVLITSWFLIINFVESTSICALGYSVPFFERDLAYTNNAVLFCVLMYLGCGVGRLAVLGILLEWKTLSRLLLFINAPLSYLDILLRHLDVLLRHLFVHPAFDWEIITFCTIFNHLKRLPSYI